MPGQTKIHVYCVRCHHERVLTELEFDALRAGRSVEELRLRCKCSECGSRKPMFLNVWHPDGPPPGRALSEEEELAALSARRRGDEQ